MRQNQSPRNIMVAAPTISEMMRVAAWKNKVLITSNGSGTILEDCDVDFDPPPMAHSLYETGIFSTPENAWACLVKWQIEQGLIK